MIRSLRLHTLSLCLLVGMSASCGAELGEDSPPAEVGGDGDAVLPGDGDGVAGDGDGGPGGDGDAGQAATCDQIGQDVGESVLRRLSRMEYRLTLQDLFQLPAPPEAELVPEDVLQEGFTTFSQLQSLTAQHLRAYWDTAAALYADLTASPMKMAQVVGCSVGEIGCLQDFTTRFGRLAFRRDLTTDEVESLLQDARVHGVDAVDELGYVVESLLVSPHFLFRVEVGDRMEGLSTLSGEEVASKLSFTLWGRAPTAELLDRGSAGELDSPEGLEWVATEMLEDPKAEYYYTQFFRQWLGYATLRAPVEPPADWSDDLMPQMTEETDALVAEYAWGETTNLFDALVANHTMVSTQLAQFYDVAPDFMGRVEFGPASPRYNAGLLGHAAILSQKTDGDKVSVRGNWLRRTFLCQELEIPPSLAEVLGEQLVGLTSMEIIEQRNTEPSCRNCHSRIDPIGVGLAKFDATGRYDASVDLSDYPLEPAFPDADQPEFSTLAELAQKLYEMPEISACLAERVFIYAHGRHSEELDTCAFEESSSGFTEEGGSFRALLAKLVLSESFRMRRAQTPSAP